MTRRPRFEESGADFSPCRTYRYALWRMWSDGGRFVGIVGLNPSTADETANDPTIRRCIGFAKAWGFDGVYVLNLFGYRATYPRDLRAAADPIGPGNDRALLGFLERCALTVAAWGVHGGFRQRGAEVLRSLRRRRRRVHCLGLTQGGYPKHPLRLEKTTRYVLWGKGIEWDRGMN